ncbi:MAG: ComF family protein [Oscillospiraceae bacterium]|nr:ComF family protein [Oscillospiraceae bacterium]
MTKRCRIAELLFPPKCAFCGRVGARGACRDCESRLPRMETALREGASYGRCAVPLKYEGTVREALLRFKFGRKQGLAAGLGLLLAQCAAEELGGEFDVVTWAPVSEKRLRERGFDQSELLARAAAEQWDAKPVRLLKKKRNNPPQSGLGAEERRGNVIGIYEAVNAEKLENARLLLIDDIVTTGSTLGECVRVLKDAGAQSVVCACVASANIHTHSDR